MNEPRYGAPGRGSETDAAVKATEAQMVEQSERGGEKHDEHDDEMPPPLPPDEPQPPPVKDPPAEPTPPYVVTQPTGPTTFGRDAAAAKADEPRPDRATAREEGGER